MADSNIPVPVLAERELLTISEFSSLNNLSESTIRRLIKQQKLEAYQPSGKHGKVLIPHDAVLRTRTASATNRPVAASTVNDGRDATRLSGPKPKWRTK